eukprot:CAMPEP_0168822892 /NCGR_PEP_ID=MMETSP0726-20121227/10217_1 /TAXON_ID=265536 /ORGANISM="Amphiprora sp., Strain CCMP467" /LENGTH=861 /DNA_ID=CAMNT_0008875685 /DNA_START=161 /DNA_END=2746 /DNA_ORIENTATION=-
MANKRGRRQSRPDKKSSPEPQQHTEGKNDAPEQRKTSRICLKQLPPPLREHRQLKAFLLESRQSYFSHIPCKITDCKVLAKRCMAFVGFSTPDAAEACVKYLHRSFYRTTRLVVEFALPPKETTSSKAPSRKEDNTSRDDDGGDDGDDGDDDGDAAMSEKETGRDADEANVKEKLEARKEEFLAVMGATAKKQTSSRLWTNDDGMDQSQDNPVESRRPKIDDDDDDDDGGGAVDADDDDDSSSDDSESSGSDEDIVDPLATTTGNSKQSDLDFFRSKTTNVEDFDSDNEDLSNGNDDNSISAEPREEEVPMKGETESLPTATEEQESEPTDSRIEEFDETDPKRLFVRNIAFDSTEEDLRAHFSNFGKVEECHMPVDDRDKGKGFAFVSFESQESASSARSALDGMDFQGRLIQVLPAKRAPTQNSLEGSNMSYKNEQELKRRRQSMKDQTGWSSSFVRGDAVVDNLAERLGLRKGDILSVKDGMSGGDAAVRLALAETAIIEENRNYFAEHGIEMEALVSFSTKDTSQKQERSKTSILVKNLPHDTTTAELEKTFSLPGSKPSRILLPPSRTIAVVEYGNSNFAKKSFKQLAYRKFKSVPLYLEFAPMSSFQEAQPDHKSDSDGANKESDELPDAENENAVDETGPTFTVYVKNLNFKTTESQLLAAFEEKTAGVRTARIPMKRKPMGAAEGPDVMSMGYGFVEFKSQENAKLAVKKLNGTMLHGHVLETALTRGSGSGASSSLPPTSSRPPSKLMVRNVPFQATRKELLQLFGSFGQLKRVRLPKKLDGNHRGFAFLEFVSGKEAATAMKALSRTHLYGRHLVLEWADTSDESVQGLREKAGRQLPQAAVAKNKKIRFD